MFRIRLPYFLASRAERARRDALDADGRAFWAAACADDAELEREARDAGLL